MSGEILADDNSPMVMTVGQYNDRVAYTWKLAIESEQERISAMLKGLIPSECIHDEACDCVIINTALRLINGEYK